MAIEQQINVQELQRLNDAIVVTMEAIRRVVPQLAVLQHAQQAQFSPFATTPSLGAYGIPATGLPMGIGQQVTGQVPVQMFGQGFAPTAQPGQTGTPFGFGVNPWVDPMSAVYMQAHAQALRTILGQPMVSPFGYNTGYGAQTMQPGFQGFSPWAFGQQTNPLAGLTQRPF